MAPKRSRPGRPTSSSLESISCPPLLSIASLPFTPRSMSPSKTSSLSPQMIGGLVAIGILSLLCMVGVGLVLHVRYCRRSDCSGCDTIVWLARLRRNHSIPDPDYSSPHPRTQWDAYTETPRDGVCLFKPSIQDGQMLSRKSLPSLTPPPTPQSLEKAMSNSVVSIRGSITPSAIFDDCAATLGACGIPSSHPSPSVGKAIHSCRTLDNGWNSSEDISVITLPSFVENERRSSTPTPVLAPQVLLMVEGARSLQTSRRSSLFRQSRSYNRIANTTTITTPSSESRFTDDLPSPSLSSPGRQPPFHRRTHSSSSQRAGVRRESTTAKIKAATQEEAVKVVQSGIPETRTQPETNYSRPDAPSPLKIPTHTLAFLDDYGSTPMGDQPRFHEERDSGAVFHDPPQFLPPGPSPYGALRSPTVLERAFSTKDTIRYSPSYHSPILGFFNSPSSHSSPNESCPRVISLTSRSSVSTVPSPSVFPSPPGFSPGPRDKVLSIISGHSISGRTFPPARFWECNPVSSVETASPNEGQTSTRLPEADASRPISTINPRPVLTRHLCLDDLFAGSGARSRFLSMRRLSRTPLGPRKMPDRPKSPRRTPQPPSL